MHITIYNDTIRTGGDKSMDKKDVRAARAAYARDWRKRNPEKQREIQNRYWEKKAREAQQDHKKGD